MTDMTDINPAATAARETARTTAGQFGVQENTAPELELVGPYAPGQPVYATITFEEYASEHDEHPSHVATQKADIVGVLDTLPLDHIETLRDDLYAHNDDIVYALQASGELIHPSHPFQLDLEPGDLDAYAGYRAVNEQTAPVAERVIPSVENLKAALNQHASDIDSRRSQLAELEAEKEQAEERILRAIASKYHPDAVRLTVLLDHPRYPVELWDNDGKWIDLGTEKEHELVDEIRTTLGDNPAVVGGRGTARVVELADPVG